MSRTPHVRWSRQSERDQRLALAQGRTVDAARWVGERRLGANDEPSYPREPFDLAQQQGGRSVDLSSRASRVAANRLYQQLGFRLRDSNATDTSPASSLASPRDHAAPSTALVRADLGFAEERCPWRA